MFAITVEETATLANASIDSAVDFSDGLGVLRAYHKDFLQQGRRLLVLAQAIQQDGFNAAGSAEAAQLAEYYRLTTRLHHRDEEHVLFPMIVNQSFLIDGMIERLALDHDEIEELWGELGGWLQTTGESLRRYLELVPQFEKALRTHIEREDTDFFPIIADRLSLEQRRELGVGMALFRRQDPSTIASIHE
jgi:hemerythrin-like domain-containing protein